MHLYCRERIRFHDVIARSRDFIDFILTILTSLDDRRAHTRHFNHRNFVIEAKLPYYRSAPIILVYYRRYPTVVVSDNTILCKIAYPMRLFCHLSISTTNVCNPDFHPQLRLVTPSRRIRTYRSSIRSLLILTVLYSRIKFCFRQNVSWIDFA